MRPEKENIVQEIRTRTDAAEFVVLADYKGMNVDQFSQLRSALRGVGAEVHVVKNRLMRVVARERGWTALDPHFKMPSAVVSGPSVVEALKALVKFRGENNNLPALKAGMLGTAFLGAAQIEELARLPSRQELRARVVGTVAAPLTGLVSVLNQKGCSLLYVLKAVEQKKSA